MADDTIHRESSASENSKHLKRHSKPFGCTHDGCNKVFGAKNDWKRHENSQHHQLECWKCDIRKYDVQSSPSALGADAADICGKCFFRKADFVKHLKVVHGNTDGWVVEQTTPAGAGTTAAETSQPVATTLTGARDVAQILFDCHIPKYHGGAFWCGFCHKVVKLHGKVGIEGWDKRFDHIAWHFEKDNLRVKDSWMRLEEPDPEGKGLGGSEGVCARDPGEESSGDEESTGYVDYIDSSPKRRQTEPGALSSFAIEQQLKSAPEGSMEDKLQSQAEWYCCRCNFGPFSYKHYVSCPNCKIPRCEKCPNEKKH
ncbi:hypothetical protein BDZ91DRAFT_132184 [Kalaharituber pfeilii]|nr:hypothetical protein BDZ91DRAFT_132184 [Kalaharituber pfeilii]